MKDAFNEGLPYTAHFVASHSFLRWSHNLLTFIIQLTLINSNLIKQKNSLLFHIKFKQFHTFCIYSKLQSIFTLYVYCSFVLILDIFVCNYCRKLLVIKYFLLTSSNDAQCILCCTLFGCYICRVLSQICINKVKNKFRFLITFKIVPDLCFVSEFTIKFFIYFYELFNFIVLY